MFFILWEISVCIIDIRTAINLCVAVSYTMIVYKQVLTRFLFSSAPLLYWFAAGVLSDALPQLPSSPPSSLSLSQLVTPPAKHLLSKPTFPLRKAQLVAVYFLSYVVIGFVLHCNFYPWT